MNDPTTIEGYLEALRSPTNTLDHICLYGKKITNDHMSSLTSLLLNNTKITWVHLGCNLITDDGCIQISELLKQNKKIASLYLNDNEISNHGVKLLAQGLRSNDTLRYLNLKGNEKITEDGQRLLVEMKEGYGKSVAVWCGKSVDWDDKLADI